MAQSKTARASMPKVPGGKSSTDQLIASAGGNRLIPLNKGKHVYYLDPVTSETLHYSTMSDDFVSRLVERAQQGYKDRLQVELTNLANTYPADGWDAVHQRLADAGAFN